MRLLRPLPTPQVAPLLLLLDATDTVFEGYVAPTVRGACRGLRLQALHLCCLRLYMNQQASLSARPPCRRMPMPRTGILPRCGCA